MTIHIFHITVTFVVLHSVLINAKDFNQVSRQVSMICHGTVPRNNLHQYITN